MTAPARRRTSTVIRDLLLVLAFVTLPSLTGVLFSYGLGTRYLWPGTLVSGSLGAFWALRYARSAGPR